MALVAGLGSLMRAFPSVREQPVAIVVGFTYMELRKIAIWVRGCELAQACRSNVTGRLFLVLRVLEKRGPEHVRNSLQLSMRAMGNYLRGDVRPVRHTKEDVHTSLRAWRERRRFS